MEPPVELRDDLAGDRVGDRRHPPVESPEPYGLPPRPEPKGRTGSPLATLRRKVDEEVAELIGARELRLLSIRRAEGGSWAARIEAYVRDPQLSISNALGSKDILHPRLFRAEFDEELELIGFELDEDA